MLFIFVALSIYFTTSGPTRLGSAALWAKFAVIGSDVTFGQAPPSCYPSRLESCIYMHAYHRPVKYGTELLAGFVLLPSPGTSPYADFCCPFMAIRIAYCAGLVSVSRAVYLPQFSAWNGACGDRGPPMCRLLEIVQCVLYLVATSNLGGKSDSHSNVGTHGCRSSWLWSCSCSKSL